MSSSKLFLKNLGEDVCITIKFISIKNYQKMYNKWIDLNFHKKFHNWFARTGVNWLKLIAANATPILFPFGSNLCYCSTVINVKRSQIHLQVVDSSCLMTSGNTVPPGSFRNRVAGDIDYIYNIYVPIIAIQFEVESIESFLHGTIFCVILTSSPICFTVFSV